MKRNKIPAHISIILNGSMILVVACLIFFFVPNLKFISYIILGAGAIMGLIVFTFMKDAFEGLDKYFSIKDNNTVTLTPLAKNEKSFDVKGLQAKEYFRWQAQNSSRRGFGFTVLGFLYSIVGLVINPIVGIAFWIVLVLLILSNLRSLHVLLLAITGWGSTFIFDKTLDEPILEHK